MGNQTATVTLQYDARNDQCTFTPNNGDVTVRRGNTMTLTFNCGNGVGSIDSATFYTDSGKTTQASTFNISTNQAGKLQAVHTDQATTETTYYYSLGFTDSGGTSRTADPQWVDKST